MSSEENNTIRVSLDQLPLKGSPGMQFGYVIQEKGLNLKVKDGQYITFIASVGISNKQERPPCLFIRDRIKERGQEIITINQVSWSEYLITKKIRKGSRRIDFGIKYRPESEDEWLKVRNIKVILWSPNEI